MAGGTSAASTNGQAQAAKAQEGVDRRDRQAKLVFKHMMLNTIALCSVFTQRMDVYLSLQQFRGDIAKAAMHQGYLTAVGSLLEFFLNPFLGKMSDAVGRKPLMLSSTLANIFFKTLVFLKPSKMALDLDKVFATLFSVAGGTTTCNASLADIYGGQPDRQANALATIGQYAALGVIGGPMFGVVFSRALGTPRAAFLASASCAALQLYTVSQMSDPLPLEKRKPFSLAGANPFSFLKLLGECRQMQTLVLISAVLQNVPEGKNLADIHQTIAQSDIKMPESIRSLFVSFFGASQVLGSIIGKKLFGSLGGQSFTSLTHYSIAAAMLWYSTVPIKLQRSWPLFVGALMQMFSFSSTMFTKAVGAEYAKAASWGQGEFQGAMANLRAIVSALVPMTLAATYAWSKRNGRHWPGLSYQLLSVQQLLTELVFRTLSSADLALKG